VEYSLSGFVGAFIGVVLGVISYMLTGSTIERAMRQNDQSKTPQEREAFEQRLSVIRRVVLGLDIAVFAALGYWLGK
jgi:hypothetical protein